MHTRASKEGTYLVGGSSDDHVILKGDTADSIPMATILPEQHRLSLPAKHAHLTILRSRQQDLLIRIDLHTGNFLEMRVRKEAYLGGSGSIPCIIVESNRRFDFVGTQRDGCTKVWVWALKSVQTGKGLDRDDHDQTTYCPDRQVEVAVEIHAHDLFAQVDYFDALQIGCLL